MVLMNHKSDNFLAAPVAWGTGSICSIKTTSPRSILSTSFKSSCKLSEYIFLDFKHKSIVNEHGERECQNLKYSNGRRISLD